MPDPDLGELAEVVAAYAELIDVTALEFGSVGRRGLEQVLVAVAIATVDLEEDLGTPHRITETGRTRACEMGAHR